MRGKSASKRKRARDQKYNNELIAGFINKIMLHGEKSVAERIFYAALENAAKEVKMEPVEFLETTVNNVRPALEIRARRVGGANYQVPMPVNPARQETLAIRWLVDAARNKSGASFDQKMMNELLAAQKGEGDAIKKKMDVERMAEANKAFAHFRW